MAVITICSSASFYQNAVTVQSTLQSYGHKVMIPLTAEKMKNSGDFVVENYKTWFGNADDFYKKTDLMKGHFKEIDKADSILVLNYEKNGMKNYIGGNVLMEMTIAFYHNKPIFLLNEVPNQVPYFEEIMGMNPIVINGDITELGQNYEQLLTVR
jgi:hypothetical protein